MKTFMCHFVFYPRLIFLWLSNLLRFLFLLFKLKTVSMDFTVTFFCDLSLQLNEDEITASQENLTKWTVLAWEKWYKDSYHLKFSVIAFVLICFDLIWFSWMILMLSTSTAVGKWSGGYPRLKPHFCQNSFYAIHLIRQEFWKTILLWMRITVRHK